ncbi:MAG: hypothetical protein QG672_831, partial [Pseudomonadota bacterium]|nr:hypothetical protein [Pseudomonadota bacterium]
HRLRRRKNHVADDADSKKPDERAQVAQQSKVDLQRGGFFGAGLLHGRALSGATGRREIRTPKFSTPLSACPVGPQGGKLAVFPPGRPLKRLNQQDFLALREGAEVLEVDHHGEKVLRLADGTIFKLFRRRRVISSAALFPYARRFAHNAAVLAGLGIPVPQVIEVFRIPSIERDAVHYQPLAGRTLREMARAGLSAERERELKAMFTGFVIGMHDKGIYFRSLHLGNVVCTPDDRLGLIDFSDLRIHPWSLGRYMRARNMRRMQGLEEETGWLDLETIIGGRMPGAGASN